MVDLEWNAGRLVSMKIHAQADSDLHLLLPEGQAIRSMHRVGAGSIPADSTLHIAKGASYEIAFQ
jgi:hypothetical protein